VALGIKIGLEAEGGEGVLSSFTRTLSQVNRLVQKTADAIGKAFKVDEKSGIFGGAAFGNNGVAKFLSELIPLGKTLNDISKVPFVKELSKKGGFLREGANTVASGVKRIAESFGLVEKSAGKASKQSDKVLGLFDRVGGDTFFEKSPVVRFSTALFFLQNTITNVTALAEGLFDSLFGANNQLAQFERTLTTVLGTSERAKKAIFEFARPFAIKTPFFESEEIIAQVNRLATEGFSLDEITGRLEDGFNKFSGKFEAQFSDGLSSIIANTAGAFGASLDEVTEAFIAATQNRFFRITKFGISRELLKSFGFSGLESDIRGRVDAIKRVLELKFGGTLTGLATTFKGAASNISDFLSVSQQKTFAASADTVRLKLVQIAEGLNLLTTKSATAQAFNKFLTDTLGGAFNTVTKAAITFLDKLFQFKEILALIISIPIANFLKNGVLAVFQSVQDSIFGLFNAQKLGTALLAPFNLVLRFAKGAFISSLLATFIKAQGGIATIFAKIPALIASFSAKGLGAGIFTAEFATTITNISKTLTQLGATGGKTFSALSKIIGASAINLGKFSVNIGSVGALVSKITPIAAVFGAVAFVIQGVAAAIAFVSQLFIATFQFVAIPAIFEAIGALNDLRKGIESPRTQALASIIKTFEKLNDKIQQVVASFVQIFDKSFQSDNAVFLKLLERMVNVVSFLIDRLQKAVDALAFLSPLFKAIGFLIKVFIIDPLHGGFILVKLAVEAIIPVFKALIKDALFFWNLVKVSADFLGLTEKGRNAIKAPAQARAKFKEDFGDLPEKAKSKIFKASKELEIVRLEAPDKAKEKSDALLKILENTRDRFKDAIKRMKEEGFVDPKEIAVAEKQFDKLEDRIFNLRSEFEDISDIRILKNIAGAGANKSFKDAERFADGFKAKVESIASAANTRADEEKDLQDQIVKANLIGNTAGAEKLSRIRDKLRTENERKDRTVIEQLSVLQVEANNKEIAFAEKLNQSRTDQLNTQQRAILDVEHAVAKLDFPKQFDLSEVRPQIEGVLSASTDGLKDAKDELIRVLSFKGLSKEEISKALDFVLTENNRITQQAVSNEKLLKSAQDKVLEGGKAISKELTTRATQEGSRISLALEELKLKRKSQEVTIQQAQEEFKSLEARSKLSSTFLDSEEKQNELKEFGAKLTEQQNKLLSGSDEEFGRLNGTVSDTLKTFKRLEETPEFLKQITLEDQLQNSAFLANKLNKSIVGLRENVDGVETIQAEINNQMSKTLGLADQIASKRKEDLNTLLETASTLQTVSRQRVVSAEQRQLSSQLQSSKVPIDLANGRRARLEAQQADRDIQAQFESVKRRTEETEKLLQKNRQDRRSLRSSLGIDPIDPTAERNDVRELLDLRRNAITELSGLETKLAQTETDARIKLIELHKTEKDLLIEKGKIIDNLARKAQTDANRALDTQEALVKLVSGGEVPAAGRQFFVEERLKNSLAVAQEASTKAERLTALKEAAELLNSEEAKLFASAETKSSAFQEIFKLAKEIQEQAPDIEQDELSRITAQQQNVREDLAATEQRINNVTKSIGNYSQTLNGLVKTTLNLASQLGQEFSKQTPLEDLVKRGLKGESIGFDTNKIDNSMNKFAEAVSRFEAALGLDLQSLGVRKLGKQDLSFNFSPEQVFQKPLEETEQRVNGVIQKGNFNQPNLFNDLLNTNSSQDARLQQINSSLRQLVEREKEPLDLNLTLKAEDEKSGRIVNRIQVDQTAPQFRAQF